MGVLSPTHWLIIIGVVVVLFGAKKLPDAARGLGRSSRILQAELRGLHDDPPAPTAENPPPPATPSALATSSATQHTPTRADTTDPAAVHSAAARHATPAHSFDGPPAKAHLQPPVS